VTRRIEDRDLDRREAVAFAELRRFRAEWYRNTSGNLVRQWEGRVVTIFRRGDGYRYSIKYTDSSVVFSPEGYRTEAGARDAVAFRLHVGMIPDAIVRVEE
jgi:hypothetical protein